MKCIELEKEIAIKERILSITRVNDNKTNNTIKTGCTLKVLNEVFSGKCIVIDSKNLSCCGASIGFGFYDGLPNIPGGFGNFLSHGKGEGYPIGERVKCNAEIGEKMLLNQPRNVMEGYSAIQIKPYEESDNPDLVTILANPDQISALVHIFNYRKIEYDTVIMPMVSGCASIFRVPFGELKRDNPRAVIGNVDVFSRPHFEKNTFFFTVSGKDFKNMLLDADESFLVSPIWSGVKSRL